MDQYIVWEEQNGWEGETWYFAINLNKNSQHLQKLKDLLTQLHKDDYESDTSYRLRLELTFTKDELIKITRLLGSGYMDHMNIIDEELDSHILREISGYDQEEIEGFLYKGGIESLFPSGKERCQEFFKNKDLSKDLYECPICRRDHRKSLIRPGECPDKCPCGDWLVHTAQLHDCSICDKRGFEHLVADCPEKLHGKDGHH